MCFIEVIFSPDFEILVRRLGLKDRVFPEAAFALGFSPAAGATDDEQDPI
jgi:hypothetical protein